MKRWMIWTALLVVPVAASGARGRATLIEAPVTYSDGSTTAVSSSDWWVTLGDPGLDQLVQDGLTSNLDLMAADARVSAQQARSVQAWAPALPQVGLSYGHQLNSCEAVGLNLCEFQQPRDEFGQPTQDVPETYGTGALTLQASMGLDVFGTTASAALAQRLEGLAQQGDQDAMALAVSARVTSAWLDWAAAAEQRAIVEQQVQTNQQLLEIVELQYERSLASGVDVLQQRQTLASAQSMLPAAETTVRLQEQQLLVLLGRPATERLGAPGTLPDLPPQPAVGVPDDLWSNRPDLRSAALRVDAAVKQERAQAKQALPSVGVRAQYAYQYQNLYDGSDGQPWSAGVSVTVPILNGGAVGAGLSAARANTDAAVIGANQALLVAISEVEAALVQEHQLGLAHDQALLQLDAALLTWELAQNQYVQGDLPYVQLLSVLNATLSAQLNELSAHRNLLGARVALHQALGGPWTNNWDGAQ